MYALFLKNYNSTNAIEISKEAINKVNCLSNLVGFEVETEENSVSSSHYFVKNHRTLTSWFNQYRGTDSFTNPALVREGKIDLPPMLNNNPELVTLILSFCRQNIDRLNTEMVHSHIINDVLPEIVKNIGTYRKDHDYCIDKLLSENGLKSLSIRTVNRWMHKLGFKYQTRKKTYYVDTHESSANVKYRHEFIERYFGYELYAHRWISISAEERQKMIDRCELDDNSGYRYKDDSGTLLFEYHIDDHN